MARCLLLFGPALAWAAEVTPVQKVVQMLANMKVNSVTAMEEEKKTFEKYDKWADLRKEDLSQNVKYAAAKVEELVAFVTKAESDRKELGNQMAALDRQINQLHAEKQAATDDRKEQHEEYVKVSQDYGESVDALQQAIQTLGTQDYDRGQAEAMLQQMARTMPGMPRVLAAFIQEKPGSGFLQRAPGAPDVAAYEFQSSKILDTLKALLDRFRGELGDVDKAEMNEAHAFSMVELHLGNTISRDTSDHEEKAVQRAKRAEASAQAKAELAAVRADKAADEKLKSEIESTFAVKQGAFEENQRVRAEELQALSQAIEILSGGDVQAGYSKHIAAALQQQPSAASFLQLRRSHRRVAKKDRVVEFLGRRAAALHSQRLAKLAADAGANPFGKVIDMVETLLERLKEEAASEADHKAWCDKELKANKIKRDKKTAEAERLMAEIEGLAATVADMAEGLEKLSQEQAKLATAMSEATDLRFTEKADNLEAIKDAGAGAEAVKRALVVLKEFYEAQSASLLQQGKQVPELSAYKGQQRENLGVVGMLEVIASDFDRLRSETEASEASAQMEYDDFMKLSEATKKEKHDAEFQLSLDKDETEFKKSQAQKDLKNTQEALAQANKYYGELKPSCVHVHVSFEERVKGRQEEIDALHDAWHLLDQKSRE